jgi:hypothetical protein
MKTKDAKAPKAAHHSRVPYQAVNVEFWEYSIKNHEMRKPNGSIFIPARLCYSGRGKYKNEPSATWRHNVGPIPEGYYEIGHIYDSAHTGIGTITLTPVFGTNTYGRSGFKIHGDSKKHPGDASEGCIICGSAMNRHAIKASHVEFLLVTK